jgi:hypothetical protein
VPVLVIARTRKNVTSVVLKNTARCSEQTPSVVLENTARSFEKHRSLFWKKNGGTFYQISRLPFSGQEPSGRAKKMLDSRAAAF